jgi:raffinose/stachyose/melibiose transport system permease protein
VSQAGVRLPRRRGGVRRVPFWLVIPGFAAVLAVHFIAPGFAAAYAFTDWSGFSSHASWVGLKNFREVFSNPIEQGAFKHTLELAVTFVILVNGIGLALAVGLYGALKTRVVLRAVFFAPAVASPLAVAFIWRYIFDYNGALNKLFNGVGLHSWVRPWLGDPKFALWTILLVLVWQYSGLVMIVYLAGLQGIPDELYEAAAVDGAGSFRMFRKITFPLLAPAFTVAATLTTIFGLRVFDQVLALTSGGPFYATETLATQVWQQTFVVGRFGYGAALALMLSLLISAVAITQLLILRRREANL